MTYGESDILKKKIYLYKFTNTAVKGNLKRVKTGLTYSEK